MANPDTFYLSAADYKEKTKVPRFLDGMENEDIEDLLLEVMTDIDAYLGPRWARLDADQEFLFPREQDVDDDGNPVIPRPLAQATRILADAVLRKERQGVLPHEIDSHAGSGVSYTKRRKATQRPGFEHFPDEVFAKLDPFCGGGGELAVSNTDSFSSW